MESTADILEEALDVAEETMELIPNTGDNDEEPVQEAADALRAYQGEDEEEWEEDPAEDEEGSLNVFLQENTDDWDIDEEMLGRTKDYPYVISTDEFFHGESGYSQSGLTFYEGDNVLADEKESDIPYPDPIVGIQNLNRFGEGSGDPLVVYIRNERLSAEYEIIKHEGKYAHEVLGLQHSDGGDRARQQRNQLRKQRGEYE
ncbi:MAG: hypothetical protein LC687_01745 [Actinobacteria bacterium]|nr:hypothetical protein [Actinomycetota bacterium]